MRERKHKLLTGSDAVVALPGGCGTLEELFEAITLKRLGLYFNPILLLDTAASTSRCRPSCSR
jgi:predicted Rossmann-fold nucleotide-binding protein